MDSRRRSRRGRTGRCHSPDRVFTPPQPRPRSGGVSTGLQTFFIVGSLMVLIYMMLDYHCKTCTAKCDLHKISKSIDDIAVNVSNMNERCRALEVTVSKFSQELPKIEGQIEILEALANTLDNSRFGWNPKTHLALPNVEVYLTQPINNNKCQNHTKKNCTKMTVPCAKAVEVF